MSVAFTSKSPGPYTAPPPNPRDSEAISRLYLALHRIHGEHSARVLGPSEDGGYKVLDIHPAEALGTDDIEYTHQHNPSPVPEGAQVVDAATAGVIVAVADALNEGNRAKFLSMNLVRMAHVAWEMV